jgi:hypothetical protein
MVPQWRPASVTAFCRYAQKGRRTRQGRSGSTLDAVRRWRYTGHNSQPGGGCGRWQAGGFSDVLEIVLIGQSQLAFASLIGGLRALRRPLPEGHLGAIEVGTG